MLVDQPLVDPGNVVGIPFVVVPDELHRPAEKAAPAVDVLTPDFMGQTGRPAVVREGTG